MKATQLVLIPPPAPKLTEKQQALLDAVTAAGQDGLSAAEAGAVLHSLKEESRWAHSRDDRCVYCPRDGNVYLRRLRQLGWVRYSGKLKVWLSIAQPQDDGLLPGMSAEIPY